MSSQAVNYEFEGYRLLTNERLLLYDGGPIDLKPKVLETLIALVRGRGRLISKADLMNEIWGESFVEEGNLTQYIFTLRKIFGERPRDHRFIVTVPGQGYSFVARVNEVASNGNIHRSYDGEPTTAPARALAVLPLKPLQTERDEEKGYLGLAIADSLITELNSSSAGSTFPTDAILKYVDTDKDALTIGRELAVESVLSGTIQKYGDVVRANLQLQNVETSRVLWAGKVDFRADDFFSLQDEISHQILTSISSRLGNRSTDNQKLRNPDNYQSFIQYRFFWETRTEDGLLTALNGSKEIVAAEPGFALGHIGVADSYLLLGHHLFLAPDKVYPAVRGAVDLAFGLDPNLAEAYATQAEYYFITKDWSSAENFYKRAISLKPEYAAARHWYGWFLMAMGRFDESLEQIELAQAFDPNSLYLGMVRGLPFFYKRQFDQAIRQFRLMLDFKPDYSRARYYMGMALLHSGDRRAGIAELENALAAESMQQTVALLGYAYGIDGQLSNAQEMLDLLVDIGSESYVSPYVRGWVYAGLGDVNGALDQLEVAYDENAISLIWLNVDMHYQSLRNEPRFCRLIQALRFPQT